MKLLLDTHAAVWAVTSPRRLPGHIRDVMLGSDTIYVSVVTLWEIGIKFQLRRPRDPMPFSASRALLFFVEAKFTILPLTIAHTIAFQTVPLLHGDPFDRMLVAQSLAESLRLVTHDGRLAAYGPTILTW